MADFLMQALQWKNEDRKTAQEMLQHPWLSMPANYDFREDDSEEDEDSEKSDKESEDEEEDSWVTLSSDEEFDGEGEASGEDSSFELV